MAPSFCFFLISLSGTQSYLDVGFPILVFPIFNLFVFLLYFLRNFLNFFLPVEFVIAAIIFFTFKSFQKLSQWAFFIKKSILFLFDRNSSFFHISEGVKLLLLVVTVFCSDTHTYCLFMGCLCSVCLCQGF